MVKNMNHDEYLALSKARALEAKEMAIKALDGQLPAGYILSDDPDQMYGNALFRIKPGRITAGSKTVHFFHKLMHRTDRIDDALMTTPSTETLHVSGDVFNGHAWETDAEWGVDGRVQSTVLSQTDLAAAVREVVSMTLSQPPFTEFKWKRDEHDSHKHHLFNGDEKFGSVWKSGDRWGTTVGISSETLGNAKVRLESMAAGIIKSSHDERLAGLGDTRTKIDHYDRNNMDAAIDYSKETQRLFRSGDSNAAFAHYMLDSNGGANPEFKDTSKDEFVVSMQRIAGGPIASMGLTSNERQAWSESGASDDDIERIAQAGGFVAIRGSGAKLLQFQDTLDHVMQSRIVGVRNELRELGWDGERGRSLEKAVGDVTLRANLVCSYTGAGKNVVNFQFDVVDVSQVVYSTVVVDNDMNKSAKVLAAGVDGVLLSFGVESETSLKYNWPVHDFVKPQFKENAAVVKDGAYSGLVTEVTGGVVTQKINRAGDVVKHEAARLNKEVKAGDVLDIAYRDGMGAVRGKDKVVEVGR